MAIKAVIKISVRFFVNCFIHMCAFLMRLSSFFPLMDHNMNHNHLTESNYHCVLNLRVKLSESLVPPKPEKRPGNQQIIQHKTSFALRFKQGLLREQQHTQEAKS